MRKLLLTSCMLTVIVLTGCSDKSGGLSATAKKNIEVSRAIAKCFETNDFSKLDDYIAENAIDHAGPTGDIVGRDSIKAVMIQMSQAMTDARFETIKDFADDEYVFMWSNQSATMKEAMMGMPAGMKYTTSVIEASKFKDGKVIEHWTFMTPEEMMKMMPQTMPTDQQADTAQKKDTATKK